MPQLSPMMGYIFMMFVLGLILVFLMSVSSPNQKMNKSKQETIKMTNLHMIK